MNDNIPTPQVETEVLAAMSRPSLSWLAGLGLAGLLFAGGLVLWAYQIRYGMGVAGITHPVGWGVYITDFVFWVGIAIAVH